MLMDSDYKWVVVEVDGGISAVSPDFRLLADVARRVAALPRGAVSEVRTRRMTLREIAELSPTLKWEDLRPFGTKFQTKVWHTLFNLTHPAGTLPEPTVADMNKEDTPADGSVTAAADITTDTHLGNTAADAQTAAADTDNPYAHLLSYTDFARLFGNGDATRAVSHAVALNPIAIIIPCHLIVPKETIDKIRRMRERFAPTLFTRFMLATADLDFGPYRYGASLKRRLIIGL